MCPIPSGSGLWGWGLPIYIFQIFPGHLEFWTPLQIPSWGPPLGCTLLQSCLRCLSSTVGHSAIHSHYSLLCTGEGKLDPMKLWPTLHNKFERYACPLVSMLIWPCNYWRMNWNEKCFQIWVFWLRRKIFQRNCSRFNWKNSSAYACYWVLYVSRC